MHAKVPYSSSQIMNIHSFVYNVCGSFKFNLGGLGKYPSSINTAGQCTYFLHPCSQKDFLAPYYLATWWSSTAACCQCQPGVTCTFHSRVLVSPGETVILYPGHYQLLSSLPHSCHAPGSNVVWWSRADCWITHIPGVVSEWETRHKHWKWLEDWVEIIRIHPAVPPPAPELTTTGIRSYNFSIHLHGSASSQSKEWSPQSIVQWHPSLVIVL